MDNIKKGLRVLFMILLLIMAAFGIGFGNALNNSREPYQDNEIRIEKVEKKEEDEDEDETKN